MSDDKYSELVAYLSALGVKCVFALSELFSLQVMDIPQSYESCGTSDRNASNLAILSTLALGHPEGKHLYIGDLTDLSAQLLQLKSSFVLLPNLVFIDINEFKLSHSVSDMFEVMVGAKWNIVVFHVRHLESNLRFAEFIGMILPLFLYSDVEVIALTERGL